MRDNGKVSRMIVSRMMNEGVLTVQREIGNEKMINDK